MSGRSSFRAAGLALVVSACSSTSGTLAVDRIEPPSAPNTADVPVQIDGTGFNPEVTTNLDNGAWTIAPMTASIGTLALVDATRQSDALIVGTVPAGIAPGTYDVTVTIGDRSDVLVAGYTVDGPTAPFMPLHVAPGDGLPGSDPVTLTGSVTIDTETLMITGATLPPGDSFDAKPQLGATTELAILHVGALVVASDANVRIFGRRPLVIVAGSDVDVQGLLDASGQHTIPGPGGENPGAGPGAGAIGTHDANYGADPGGGGGGYGTAGAAGGTAIATSACNVTDPGGAAGAAYGNAAISVLVGGSGGGSSSGTSCLPLDQGGAGGGAFQISSATTILISGVINAGGGGGTGGTNCNPPSGDVNSGAGGGAGGSIVLQAPMILNTGAIVANGGAGGGAGSTSNGGGTTGADGGTTTAAAVPGTGNSANGGAGGASPAPAAGGPGGCGANGGGGGGAVGRIAVSTGFVNTGVVSPAPYSSLPAP